MFESESELIISVIIIKAVPGWYNDKPVQGKEHDHDQWDKDMNEFYLNRAVFKDLNNGTSIYT